MKNRRKFIVSISAITIFALVLSAFQPSLIAVFANTNANNAQSNGGTTADSLLSPQLAPIVPTSMCNAIGARLGGSSVQNGNICDVAIARSSPTITASDGTVLNPFIAQELEFQVLNGSASSTTSTTSSSVSSTASQSSSSSSSSLSSTSPSSSSSSSATTMVSGSNSNAADPVTVVMPQNVGADQSLNFQPSTFTVVVGVNNTITFADQDSQSGAPHDVHWLTQPSGASAADSPQVMTAGQTYTVTLTVPGTYTYDCIFHPGWMKGTITVKSGSTASTSVSSSTTSSTSTVSSIVTSSSTSSSSSSSTLTPTTTTSTSTTTMSSSSSAPSSSSSTSSTASGSSTTSVISTTSAAVSSSSSTVSTSSTTGYASTNVFVLAEFALLQSEVAPVESVLAQSGWTVSAVHDHYVGETPQLTFIHAYTTGNLNTVIQTVQQVLSLTTTSTSSTSSTGSSTSSTTTTSSSSATATAPTINIGYKPGVGYYLTNATGWTLYYFLKDAPNSGTSNCNGSCAKIWPPFYAANIVLPPGSGLNASNFGTITRSDGSKQTTYNGSPLYYFASDKNPGDTHGQGVASVWYAYNIPAAMGSCSWIGQFFSSYAASSANGVCNVSVERQTPQVLLTNAGSATPTIPSPIPVTLDPKTTALLLLDFTFCPRFSGCTTSALPGTANLLQAARAAGVSVIYTRVPIPSAIANKSGDTVITNDIGPDKFLNTSLASILSSHGIKTVIIGGVATNGAVLYTALEASMRGYSVVIPEDATYAQSNYVQSYTLYQLLNGPGTSNPTNSPPHPKSVTLTTTGMIQFSSATASSSVTASSASSAASSSTSISSATQSGSNSATASSSSVTLSGSVTSSSSAASTTMTSSSTSSMQIVLNPFQTVSTQFSFMPISGSGPSATMYVDGDLALTPSEVTPVLQTLVNAGFDVSAVESHIINESPQLTMIHFSTTGNIYAIVHVLKTALAQTTILGQQAKTPLTIVTQDSSGNTITGLFQVELQNGTVVTDVGFSPVTFDLISGHTYQVMADDYGQYTFSHWSDTGSTDRIRTVSITSATQLVAVYNVGVTSTTSASSSTTPPTTSTTITSSSTTTSTPPPTSTSTTTTSSSTTSSSTMTTSATTSSPTSSTTTTPSSTTTTTSAPSGGSSTIVMPQGVGANSALNFQPSTLSVAAGSTITFSDQDTTAPHNVVWLSMPSGASVPNSPIVMTNGNTFTVTLTVPGTYTYNCQYHSAWMKGTITVT